MQMPNTKVLILGTIAFLCLLAASAYRSCGTECIKSQSISSSDEALTHMYQEFPDFQQYTNEEGSRKIVTIEEDEGGWYLAFVRLGYTRSIMYAQCFFVGRDGVYKRTGEYSPSTLIGNNPHFSAQHCQ